MYSPVGFSCSSFSCTRISASDRAEGSGVAVRQIDSAVGQADIIEHRFQFGLRNGLADDAVHLIGQPRGFFNAQSGARAEVQANLPGVNLRKEVPAQNKNQQRGQNAKHQESRRKQ